MRSSSPMPAPRALVVALLAVLAADLMLRFNPTGFMGGSTDDQRYLDAALRWYAHGADAGTTHWELRHPLILSIVASFKLFGANLEALQLVPRAWYALLVGTTAFGLARLAGLGVAMLWTALAALSPVLHEMATSCFPEMAELALVALSLWCFHVAWRAGRMRVGLLVASGFAAGAAVLTRETAAAVLVVYGLAFLFRPGMPRLGYLWMAVGFVVPVAADCLWLWHETGDLLYRYHVSAGHVRIASAHLKGGVYTGGGGPILNFDLASRWVPSGPLPVHWTIDPLLNFLIDPAFGVVFVAWGLLAWRARKRGTGSVYQMLRPALIALAVASVVLTTWVLMLRPQPRYYLPATWAATIAVALLAAQGWSRRDRRRGTAVILALVGLGGFVAIGLQPDRSRPARLVVPYVEAHPGRFWMKAKERERIAFQLNRAGLSGRVLPGDPPSGGVALRIVSPKPFKVWKPVPERAGYVPVETTRESRPWFHRLLASPTQAERPGLRVERRVDGGASRGAGRP